jgi:hypothetical protein
MFTLAPAPEPPSNRCRGLNTDLIRQADMTEATGPSRVPFDQVAYSASYYQRNKDRIKAQNSAYQRAHLEEVAAYHREYRHRQRAEAIAAYGGSCDCCGETEPAFLTIHHIEGGGNAHRQEVCGSPRRAGQRFYAWLKRQGWPEGFAVRCWNCNSGAMVNGGICPHEETIRSDGSP